MTNYYIEKEEKIVLYDTDKVKLTNTLKFMPQYEGLEVKETEKEIISRNGEFVFAEDVADELLQEAKEAKIDEATDKAYSFEEKDALITVNATNMKSRASGIYHIEATLTNNIKLSAYAQSLEGEAVLPWNTKENVNVLLNKTACTTLTGIMSQLNAKLWTVDFPTFLAQIEAAETLEDVEAIEVVYENPAEVVDVNILPLIEDDPNGDDLSPDENEATDENP